MNDRITTYAAALDYSVFWTPGNVTLSSCRDLSSIGVCPYCQNDVRFEYLDHLLTPEGLENYTTALMPDFSLKLYRCQDSRCGWWSFRENRGDAEYGRMQQVTKWGHTKVFEVSSKDVPIKALRKEISANPLLVYGTHHSTFERLMVDCLHDKFPGSMVTHVGKVRDRGIDIYCVVDGEPLLVQVKRREAPGHTEGVEVVRALNGVLLRDGVYRGMVISTSEKFSREAHEETAITMPTEKPVVVELIALDGIIDLISQDQRGYEPWMDFLVLAGQAGHSSR